MMNITFNLPRSIESKRFKREKPSITKMTIDIRKNTKPISVLELTLPSQKYFGQNKTEAIQKT
jgi:hypothetical protein